MEFLEVFRDICGAKGWNMNMDGDLKDIFSSSSFGKTW